MIFDSFHYFKTYFPVHPLLTLISEFIHSHELSNLPLGKCNIRKGIYLNKNEYVTGEIQSKFIESHRRYIDIHLVVEGKEKIGFCNRDDCRVLEKYDEEKDLEKLNGECTFITLTPGYFCVLFPHDAHMPGINADSPKQMVKKVVFKIPV